MHRYQITIKLFFTFILLVVPVTIQAAPVVQLTADTGKYNLGLHAEILEDVQSDLTIEQVSSQAYSNQWILSKQDTPNFAFSDSVYWMRITLTSNMQVSKTWWFEVAFALQDYIDYYILYEGTVVSSSHTGDRLSFRQRQVEYHNFIFTFPINPDETRQIYLRLQSHDGMHEPCPVILWDQQEFALTNGTRNLGTGLYFGIMMAMAIYNFFIFLVVRDRAYAYYVIYIIGFLVWLTSYFGYTFQYLWPDSPEWANQVILLSSSVWAVFMILFIRDFLNTRKHAPWFETVSKLTILCFIFNIIFSFTGRYVIGIQIIISLGIIFCMATIAAGFICLKAGYRPARYFLLAWTTLLISLVVFALKIAGVLPATFLFEKSIQIGSAIEVILLSLGLADRINVLENEKYLAQRDARQAIESSLKLKNDFITSISHELRTPMNAIIGGLEIAKKHTRELLKPPLDIVQHGASDMMNLINDILIYTEIQSDRLTIQTDHIEIMPLLDSLKEPYQNLCKDSGLHLVWQIDALMPMWICTDREKLITIVSKLLNNAIKFTEQGQVELHITCDQSTKPWQFICSVKDTGIGIAKEENNIVLKPFTQSDGGLRRRFGGLGIGLSICKKLTEALGGQLRFESDLGKGSTFTAVIPIEPGIVPIHFENTHLASADLPILVVEDNLVNQKLMIKILEKLGYQSRIASHGKEALRILENETISLVLMDLQMPVMDGLTCTAKIRERSDQLKNIPIIAITANLMDADKKQCIDCGMNDYLKKPINLDDLRCILSCYIEGNRQGSIPVTM